MFSLRNLLKSHSPRILLESCVNALTTYNATWNVCCFYQSCCSCSSFLCCSHAATLSLAIFLVLCRPTSYDPDVCSCCIVLAVVVVVFFLVAVSVLMEAEIEVGKVDIDKLFNSECQCPVEHTGEFAAVVLVVLAGYSGAANTVDCCCSIRCLHPWCRACSCCYYSTPLSMLLSCCLLLMSNSLVLLMMMYLLILVDIVHSFLSNLFFFLLFLADLAACFVVHLLVVNFVLQKLVASFWLSCIFVDVVVAVVPIVVANNDYAIVGPK